MAQKKKTQKKKTQPSTKRKASSPQKQGNKNLLTSSVLTIPWEMIGLFLFVIGVLSLLSLTSTNMGILGKAMATSVRVLFGELAILGPIALFLVAIALFFKRKTEKSWVRPVFLFLGWALLLSLMIRSLHLWDDVAFSEKMRLCVQEIPYHTGVVGTVLSHIFVLLLGTTGTYVFLGLDTVIFLFLVAKSLPRESLQSVGEKFKTPKPPAASQKKTIREQADPAKVTSSQQVFDAPPVDVSVPIRGIHEDQPLEPQEAKAEPPKKRVKREEEEPVSMEVSKIQGEYHFPPVDLLKPAQKRSALSLDAIRERGAIIESTLQNFGLDCHVVAINRGPVITCYELDPPPGVRLSRIVNLADNLALSLASPDIRIEAPIPGKSVVGIEVPNPDKDAVSFREIVESGAFQKSSTTPLALGKDVSGETVISSIDQMPHLLVAGATGSGKSVCINTILTGILFRADPKEVRLILIDPKVVELSVYNGIPHLLIPVVTDPKKAAFALHWAVEEMERRYKLFAQYTVRDMNSFNQKMEKEKTEELLPKIVVVVDELADLMMVASKEVEDSIARLAQMARAAGIYLIIATQRPSVDVITGTIKANIPSRIAFAVSSQVDSRTILDMAGAEKLLGKGDMLFYPSFYSKPKRLQGAFISDSEVESIVSFVKEHCSAQYDEDIAEGMEQKVSAVQEDMDPLVHEAIRWIVRDEQASVSFLQRRLKVGYSRAARIIDDIEALGIIGPHEGTKPRKLLLSEEEKAAYLSEEDTHA